MPSRQIADGSVYFVSDRPSGLGPRNLYRAARRADGTFEPAIPVGPPINTEHKKGDTFVAPDESYLILKSNNREGYGSGDLFVAFRTPDGGWTEPKNMGPVINSEELECCPMVSPDGRWLSFSRRYRDHKVHRCSRNVASGEPILNSMSCNMFCCGTFVLFQ